MLTHSSASADVPVPRQLFDLYNATVQKLPKARDLTGERHRRARTRLARWPSLAFWREVFETAETLPFYCGAGSRGWCADLDFFLANDTNGVKVLERARAGPQRWTSPRTAGNVVALGNAARRIQEAAT